jgi:integrase
LRIEEIEDGIWTVPGEGMKGRKGKTQDFRVPLSPEALGVIEEAKRHARNGWLFPNVRKGVMSNGTMIRLMERRGLEARPHGFRSSFYGWGTETLQNYILMEKALAHVIGNKTQQAYDRSDALDARRPLMEAWASVVTGA